MKNRKRFKLKSNKVVNVFPMSDVHCGTPQFNQEYFEYMLDKIEHTSGYKIIYLLGDLMDCATKRLGNSAYKQVWSVEEQLEYITAKLKPFKNCIRGCVNGNHESRFKKEFDLDIMKVLCDNLDICYDGIEIYDTFCINGEPYTIWGTHGTKTSQQQHLMMGNVERQTNHIEANLYLYGHCHYSANWSKVMKNGGDYKRKHYCLTGHFLNYDGYAQEKLLKPSLPSFNKITINKNFRTNIEQYNLDEQRDDIYNL